MSDEATELRLYIVNDGKLYERATKPVYKNLATKWAQGKYDSKLAVKAFEHVVEQGARAYAKEFSVGTDWSTIFPPAVRREVATGMRDYFETEWKLGHFRDFLPAKYQEDTRTATSSKKSDAQIKREVDALLRKKR